MKTSNTSDETVTRNNSESDTNSEHVTSKSRLSVSEDENNEELRTTFTNPKNMNVNYDQLSTKAFLKTQTNRSNSRRSFNFSGNKTKEGKLGDDNMKKEAELKVIYFLSFAY